MRFLFVTYAPTERYFWLVRLNITVIRDLKCLEITTGLFGYGCLFQIYYRKK